MHQDYPYFPHVKHTMMAGILHLNNAEEANGCVRIYPGSHKEGPLPCVLKRSYLDTERDPIEGAIPCLAKRGNMLFFNYLLIHGSGPNRSDQDRKTVLIQVRDSEDLPTNDVHHSHAQGFMLHGINPLKTTEQANVTLKTDNLWFFKGSIFPSNYRVFDIEFLVIHRHRFNTIQWSLTVIFRT